MATGTSELTFPEVGQRAQRHVSDPVIVSCRYESSSPICASEHIHAADDKTKVVFGDAVGPTGR